LYFYLTSKFYLKKKFGTEKVYMSPIIIVKYEVLRVFTKLFIIVPY